MLTASSSVGFSFEVLQVLREDICIFLSPLFQTRLKRHFPKIQIVFLPLTFVSFTSIDTETTSGVMMMQVILSHCHSYLDHKKNDAFSSHAYLVSFEKRLSLLPPLMGQRIT